MVSSTGLKILPSFLWLRYSYLNQTKIPFSKTENRKVKQVLSGVWYQWEWGKSVGGRMW
jgi:hypothetical protein